MIVAIVIKSAPTDVKNFPQINKLKLSKTHLIMRKDNGLTVKYPIRDVISFEIYPHENDIEEHFTSQIMRQRALDKSRATELDSAA